MAQPVDHKQKLLPDAEGQFQEYERLVGMWIDNFLQSQRSIVAQISPPDNVDTVRLLGPQATGTGTQKLIG